MSGASARKSPNRDSLYGRRWKKARKAYLVQHPLCVMCRQQGRLTAATLVDHVKPHNGDEALFWDVNNWQALCQPHHDSAKQRIEKGGHEAGYGVDGVPIDKAHHWRRER